MSRSGTQAYAGVVGTPVGGSTFHGGWNGLAIGHGGRSHCCPGSASLLCLAGAYARHRCPDLRHLVAARSPRSDPDPAREKHRDRLCRHQRPLRRGPDLSHRSRDLQTAQGAQQGKSRSAPACAHRRALLDRRDHAGDPRRDLRQHHPRCRPRPLVLAAYAGDRPFLPERRAGLRPRECQLPSGSDGVDGQRPGAQSPAL